MNNLYFGGVPTGPTVKKIEEAFPDIDKRRGDLLTHEQLEALVNQPRDSARYKTVLSAYRRKVFREHGIVITGRGTGGEGFRILTDDDQTSWAAGERVGASRKVRRGFVAVTNVDEAKLSPEHKRLREHELMSYGKIQAALIQRKLLNGKK